MHKCFAARSRNCDVLMKSSSGGVFFELAKSVVKSGGIAVGASWGDSVKNILHVAIGDEGELYKIQGSKYAVSSLTSVIPVIADALRAKKTVLFSGTPCQTAAMQKKFGDGDGFLILCSVFCHSVPQKDVWEKYVADVESENGYAINRVNFKKKDDGWRQSKMLISFENSSKILNGPVSCNAYMKAFISGLSAYESCLTCRYKGDNAVADIQLGDFWGVENILPKIDDNRGLNACILRSEVALRLFYSAEIDIWPVRAEDIQKGNPMLIRPVSPNMVARKKFLSLYKEKGVQAAVDIALSYQRCYWQRVSLILKRFVSFCKQKIGV